MNLNYWNLQHVLQFLNKILSYRCAKKYGWERSKTLKNIFKKIVLFLLQRVTDWKITLYNSSLFFLFQKIKWKNQTNEFSLFLGLTLRRLLELGLFSFPRLTTIFLGGLLSWTIVATTTGGGWALLIRAKWALCSNRSLWYACK